MSEWIVSAICLCGNLFNIYKKRACFVLWGIGNVLWLIWDIRNGVYSRAFLDIVQLVLSITGFVAWGEKLENNH